MAGVFLLLNLGAVSIGIYVVEIIYGDNQDGWWIKYRAFFYIKVRNMTIFLWLLDELFDLGNVIQCVK